MKNKIIKERFIGNIGMIKCAAGDIILKVEKVYDRATGAIYTDISYTHGRSSEC